jgi:pimeloyl-ACP methyl ester carboxylesterase
MRTNAWVAIVFTAFITTLAVACSDDSNMQPGSTTRSPIAPGTMTGAGIPGAVADTGIGAGTTGGSTGAPIVTPPTGSAGTAGSAGGAGPAGSTAGTMPTSGTPTAGGGGATGASDAGSADGSTSNDGGAMAMGTDPLPPLPPDKALPLVFVHGFVGSAQQYMSQAQRFVANGYPPERIRAYEHDGAGTNTTSFVTGLGRVVDALLAEFKTDKIYLVGHSRGTFVSSSYLASNASKVAKYIAVDGSGCSTSIPCIAPSQAMFRGQKHVEVCTSKESFAMQYEFLIGSKPQVVDIVPQRAPVEISGRVVNFPANTGRAGTTLKLFELVASTGARAQSEPVATFMIGEEGTWGPVTVSPDKYYEFELTGGGSNTTGHFYWQRFLRSSNLVRLLSGPPDSPARMNTNTSDMHAALVVSRQREWLASDVLEIGTKSPGSDQPAINVMTAAAGARNAIGIHIHDAASSPGNSSLDPLPYFSSQSFQYGVDVFMPASDPPTGVITLRNLPRGDMAKPQVLNIPNWRSSAHAISVTFSDAPQD